MEEQPQSPGTRDPVQQQVPVHEPEPPQRHTVSLRPVYAALLVILGICMGIGGLFAYQEYVRPAPVTSYDECVKANGGQVNLMYPPTCITKDGVIFRKEPDPGLTPEPDPTLECTEDADCTVAIDPTSCCACPVAVNTSSAESGNLEPYVRGKNYTTGTQCGVDAACAPCEPLSQPRCIQDQCTLQSAAPLQTDPDDPFVCPASEWVDCEPSPDAGIKWECTEEYLSWAKTNCPGFQGAAL